MIQFSPATECRLSGESLATAEVLFELERCPLPGVYPATADEARPLRAPLRVVQARESRFVQLGLRLDGRIYERYAFSGGVPRGYRQYLDEFAGKVAERFPRTASVLEVGCGDTTLLRRLANLGYRDLIGIDPSLALPDTPVPFPAVRGFFPADMPAHARDRRHSLVILRHVLEHIETPRAFVADLARAAADDGELWIEVPDLEATVARGLWSNFYHLHCNYFEAATLDRLLFEAGFGLVQGEQVDVFGGSLLRRYRRGASSPTLTPHHWPGVDQQVRRFQQHLARLAAGIPPGTVGYGAAERTAVTLGFCPELADRITRLHDGNPLLAGRYLAGTALPIESREALYAKPPPAVLLFAISHRREILAEFRERLPLSTLVGIAGDDFAWAPLGDHNA